MAKSRRRRGELRVSSWRQKLTRPRRWPKNVPVMVEETLTDSVSESEETGEGWKAQQVGIMHSIKERNERRKRTSLVQSTDVVVSIMFIGPLWFPKSIILIVFTLFSLFCFGFLMES